MPKNYEVDTIAGWSLRFSTAYPETSGVPANQKLRDIDWDEVYRGACRVLQTPVREVVAKSYSGMYVDEYQDCTKNQHELIVECSKIVPCRVLGDLLQGIFGFEKLALVTKEEVEAAFEALPPLGVAWRWKDRKELGAWLQDVRKALIEKREVNLTSGLPACVRWVQLPEDAAFDVQREICQKAKNSTPAKQSVVAIYGPEEFHRERRLGAILWGQFDIVEPVTCPDLYKAAEALDSGTGNDKAIAILEFAEQGLTKISTTLKKTKTALKKGKVLDVSESPVQIRALEQVREKADWPSVQAALLSLRNVPGAKPKRRELLDEMSRALREVVSGDASSLEEAVYRVRERTSRVGRSTRQFTLGRTVLVKGLEFDHAIVLEADTLGINDLYVALTRGSRSLTILCRDGILGGTAPT